MAPQTSPVDPPVDTCRRRDLRLQILGQLYGYVVALDVPLAVQNLSPGGFAIESPIPFATGTSHQFRFTTDQQRPIVIGARTVHCMRYVTPRGQATYLIGFEFLFEPDADAARAAIDQLFDGALSVLSFQ